MFFLLSKVLDALLSPYTWGVALLALAVPWRAPSGATPAKWRRKRTYGAVGLVVILAFSMEPVANRLALHLERSAVTTYRPSEVYDVVVLLGGIGDERVFSERGQPSMNDSVERLLATWRLLVEGRARVAIVSGGAESPDLAEFSEAKMLAGQMEAWGIEPSRLIVEAEAKNTRENAVFSERIAKQRGFEKVLVVTSAYHMRRARECFAAVGMNVDTLAVDFRAHAGETHGSDAWIPRAMFLSESVKMLREMAGLYIYRFQGYGKPAG